MDEAVEVTALCAAGPFRGIQRETQRLLHGVFFRMPVTKHGAMPSFLTLSRCIITKGLRISGPLCGVGLRTCSRRDHKRRGHCTMIGKKTRGT